jgi:tRNA (cmo5U34)-methyltransferase
MKHPQESPLLAPFEDPEFVARYAEGPPRFVPGFADLHRMMAQLLGEHAPRDARVLVLGAGGGLELRTLARSFPQWTFDGVDPSAQMLALARETLSADAPRATLHCGTIDDAPSGPFQAATCLLTLHFLSREERARTLREVHRRLEPGASFVAVHASFPQRPAERREWLERYARFALGSGADPAHVEKMREGVESHLHLLEPAEDEALIRAAGFRDAAMFYAAFTWRGWIARA